MGAASLPLFIGHYPCTLFHHDEVEQALGFQPGLQRWDYIRSSLALLWHQLHCHPGTWQVYTWCPIDCWVQTRNPKKSEVLIFLLPLPHAAKPEALKFRAQHSRHLNTDWTDGWLVKIPRSKILLTLSPNCPSSEKCQKLLRLCQPGYPGT